MPQVCCVQVASAKSPRLAHTSIVAHVVARPKTSYMHCLFASELTNHHHTDAVVTTIRHVYVSDVVYSHTHWRIK
jgi:hypothetical protein